MQKSSAKPKLLDNHQRCWIWGRHLIETTLAAGRWPVLELLLSERLPAEPAARLRAEAARLGISVITTTPAQIERRCRDRDHQGMAARMPPFPYRSSRDWSGPAGEGLILMLDAVQDAHNFGAILRSADVFGVQSFWIARRFQVGVTSMVARASAGAVNHLPIYRVDDLGHALDRMRARGVRTVAASEKGGLAPARIDWRRPTVLILGNEGRGIRPELLQRCDLTARIPQKPGAVGSLNVAAAAAVLLYESIRARDAHIAGPRS